jgi:anaerobic nitric oxide reductase flavorubredoxin
VDCSVLRLGRTALAEAARAVLTSRAFLVGAPTLNTGVLPSVGGFMAYIKGLKPKERLAGAYGSYGWSGGAVKQIDADLRGMGLEVLDPLEIKYVPSADDLGTCVEYGRQVAKRVMAWGS